MLAAACGDSASATKPDAPVPAEKPATKASEEAPTDPNHARKLKDLDTLCAALNHDYVDGTLSDYFKDVEVQTDWGRAAMREGNEADRPGRYLEQKLEELSPKAKDPALPACQELLDYIDEVE